MASSKRDRVYILSENSSRLDDVGAKRLIKEGQYALQQLRGHREELEQMLQSRECEASSATWQDLELCEENSFHRLDQLCRHGESASCRKMAEIEELRKQISSIDMEINDYENRIREATRICEAPPASLEKSVLVLVRLSNILGIGLGVLADGGMIEELIRSDCAKPIDF